MARTNTDLTAFLSDCDAGVFAEKVGRALSDVAHAVVNNPDTKKAAKKGKVVLTFDIEQMGDGMQVMVEHDVMFDLPTSKGRRKENNRTQTPMTTDINGNISLFPSDQEQLFSKEQAPPAPVK